MYRWCKNVHVMLFSLLSFICCYFFTFIRTIFAGFIGSRIGRFSGTATGWRSAAEQTRKEVSGIMSLLHSVQTAHLFDRWDLVVCVISLHIFALSVYLNWFSVILHCSRSLTLLLVILYHISHRNLSCLMKAIWATRVNL